MEQNRVRVLDLDDVIEVPLGDRTFTIRQQRRAIIEQVVNAIHEVEELVRIGFDTEMKAGEEEKELPWADLVANTFANWDNALPAYALMLGVEPQDADYQETMAYLKDNLPFPKAERIFNEWYELNEVRRFFLSGGNPLIPRRDYEERLAAVRNQIAEEVQTATSALN